jgi:hypothetical protein
MRMLIDLVNRSALTFLVVGAAVGLYFLSTIREPISWHRPRAVETRQASGPTAAEICKALGRPFEEAVGEESPW